MVLECPNCYRYIEPNWEFCSGCGIKLDSDDNELYAFDRKQWMKKHGWNGKTWEKKV